MSLSRILAACGALLVGAATLSQGWVSVREGLGEGRTLGQGVWIYLCYFTVLTNILVTLVLARAALKPGDRRGFNSPRVELMAVTSILFVGAVYNLLLASQWDPQGLRKVNDVILHDGSPLLFALFWLLRPRARLGGRDAAFAAIWPGVYTLYGQARGAIDGYYPYFFTDPTRTPWPNVALNMVGLMVVFVIGALVLTKVDRTLRRAPA